MTRRRWRAIWPLFLTGSVLLAGCAGSGQKASLSPEDVAAIQAVDKAYTDAWLADDREAILATLTEDAVLLPHHGVAPIIGPDAIREFWWPAGSPPSRVSEFTRVIEEIGGQPGLAYVRGRFTLTFWFEEGGERKALSNQGDYPRSFDDSRTVRGALRA